MRNAFCANMLTGIIFTLALIVPYLTANYADIDVVDFRNYNYGLDKLIADNSYDQILVLYNFDSFKSDPYLYRAGVTG